MIKNRRRGVDETSLHTSLNASLHTIVDGASTKRRRLIFCFDDLRLSSTDSMDIIVDFLKLNRFVDERRRSDTFSSIFNSQRTSNCLRSSRKRRRIVDDHRFNLNQRIFNDRLRSSTPRTWSTIFFLVFSEKNQDYSYFDDFRPSSTLSQA